MVRSLRHRCQSWFVLTHLGLLVLLAGVAQSALGTVDGRMTLRPGVPCNSITLVNRSMLRVSNLDSTEAASESRDILFF